MLTGPVRGRHAEVRGSRRRGSRSERFGGRRTVGSSASARPRRRPARATRANARRRDTSTPPNGDEEGSRNPSRQRTQRHTQRASVGARGGRTACIQGARVEPPGSSGDIPEPESPAADDRSLGWRDGAQRIQRCDGRSRLRARSSSTPRSTASRRRRPACIALRRRAGHRQDAPARLATSQRRGRGFLVLVGSATEFEHDLPFSVWIDALDAYVASQELDLDETWNAEQVDELAEIIPSVRRLARMLAPPSRTSVIGRTEPSGGCSSFLPRAAARRRARRSALGATTRRSSSSPRCSGARQTRPSSWLSAFRPWTSSWRAFRRRSRCHRPEGSSLGQLSEAQATQLLGELDPRAAAAV